MNKNINGMVVKRVPAITPEQLLANRIVEGACADWREAMRGRSYTGHKTPAGVIREVETFFNSGFYSLLTSVSPEYLLDRLMEEYRDGLELIDAGNRCGELAIGEEHRFTCPICGGAALVTKKRKKYAKTHIKIYRCKECNAYEWRDV